MSAQTLQAIALWLEKGTIYIDTYIDNEHCSNSYKVSILRVASLFNIKWLLEICIPVVIVGKIASHLVPHQIYWLRVRRVCRSRRYSITKYGTGSLMSPGPDKSTRSHQYIMSKLMSSGLHKSQILVGSCVKS